MLQNATTQKRSADTLKWVPNEEQTGHLLWMLLRKVTQIIQGDETLFQKHVRSTMKPHKEFVLGFILQKKQFHIVCAWKKALTIQYKTGFGVLTLGIPSAGITDSHLYVYLLNLYIITMSTVILSITSDDLSVFSFPAVYNNSKEGSIHTFQYGSLSKASRMFQSTQGVRYREFCYVMETSVSCIACK